MPVALAMIQDALVLQIPVRLAPPVFIDDICKRDTADWPKPAHGVADRQQGIRMDAGRQSESGLSFLLELQIQRRQGRAQTERSRRQQHVLNRWIDRRARRAGRGAAFEDSGLAAVGHVRTRLSEQRRFPVQMAFNQLGSRHPFGSRFQQAEPTHLGLGQESSGVPVASTQNYPFS
jgi:hypothetical protein